MSGGTLNLTHSLTDSLSARRMGLFDNVSGQVTETPLRVLALIMTAVSLPPEICLA